MLHTHARSHTHTQTGKVRKEKQEDNDFDADKRTAMAAHSTSSSYDIDKSPVEREAEVIFPIHILHKHVHPVLHPPLGSSLQEAASCSTRVSARTIFIEACIHRGWITWNSVSTTVVVTLTSCWRDADNAAAARRRHMSVVVLSLTATETLHLLLIAFFVAPFPAYSYFPPHSTLSLDPTSLVPSRNTSMHYEALLAGHV